jgi:hypothetical protein
MDYVGRNNQGKVVGRVFRCIGKNNEASERTVNFPQTPMLVKLNSLIGGTSIDLLTQSEIR